MTDRGPLVIIGTGLAGYTLAREFRALDSERPLLLVSHDDGAFYSKPMLSNALSQGRDPEALVTATAEQMAERLQARILTHRSVRHIDRAAHRLLLEDGEQIEYATLVLTVGARPIRIPLEGNAADSVYSINSLEDYRRFRTGLDGHHDVLIMGAGLIGCEFANDLAATGHAVHVADPAPRPLGRLAPPPNALRLLERLQDLGVDWHLEDHVARLSHAGSGAGLRALLASGAELETDIVLSAVGLRPDTRLAEDAGLECNRGIVVDHLLRTTDPDIYALGDCIELDGQVLPFVQPIMVGAKALARTLAGEPTEVRYPPMPVVVKTPACPTVVAPPPPDTEGNWQVEEDEAGIVSRFVDVDGHLRGFALSGDRVRLRQALTAKLQSD
ncbi:MAG: FAD-dependent oxidoreductase [Gammaproteobacteria bacterium]|nr:MAG: FAD-dependent oxidoreductase [Gammaproteobacteria bacterium]